MTAATSASQDFKTQMAAEVEEVDGLGSYFISSSCWDLKSRDIKGSTLWEEKGDRSNGKKEVCP